MVFMLMLIGQSRQREEKKMVSSERKSDANRVVKKSFHDVDA